MEEMWEYSGQIWFDRVGDGAGGLIYLPWVVYSPIGLPLTEDQLRQHALQIAMDFMNAFRNSDQERAELFEYDGGFEITSILRLFM